MGETVPVGVAEEGDGEGEPSAHAGRVHGHGLANDRVELEDVDGVLDVSGGVGVVHPGEARADVVREVLVARQVLEEDVNVEDDGDAGPELPDELPTVLAADEDRAVVLARQAPLDHLEQAGGGVGVFREEAEDFPVVDGQTRDVYGGRVGLGLANALEDDRRSVVGVLVLV